MTEYVRGPVRPTLYRSLGTALAGALITSFLAFGTANAAVFDRDDRSPVPDHLSRLEEQIGRLHNPQIGTNCTAFCVAPNIVATAAHCLFRKPAGRTLRMSDFRFDLKHNGKYQQTTIEGAATKAAGQHIVTGTTRLRVRPPIDAGSDWALMRTAANICENREIPIQVETTEAIENASDHRDMFQIAYHSDYRDWELAYSKPCKVRSEFPDLRLDTIRRDFTNTESLILHQCDTQGASSGSPMLMHTDNGPVVVGINVGTYVQSKVLIRNGQVARKFEARPVANTGVNARMFEEYVQILQDADILTSTSDIQKIQSGLHQADLYRGAIDGVYGNRTRLAIKAFEKRRNLRTTGLPSRDLLDIMDIKTPPVPARKPTLLSENQTTTDAINHLLQSVD